MKLNQLIAFITVSIFFMFSLIIILNWRERKGRIDLLRGGFILDFNEDQEESENLKRYFKVDGFKFYNNFPMWKIKTLRSKDIWLLRSDGVKMSGSIQLTNFQKNINKLEDVIVDIRYHVSWEEKSGLTISGTNLETGEQVLEMLNSVTEPSIYCRKIIFLGLVEQVTIEAYSHERTAFVVIDELKVAVGTNSYDKEEEFVCS